MSRPFVVWLVITAVTGVSADELQRRIPDSEAALVTQSKELRLDKHDLNGAEGVVKEVLRRYPEYYKAHYNLGLVYQSKGDYAAAIEELEKAHTIRESENLSDYSIYNTLAWVYMLQGDMKKAESYYMTALKYEAKNTPDSNTRLYNNLAWFYYNLGKPEEAEKYVDVAANRYHSKAAVEMKRLIEQLEVDQQKIKARSDFPSPEPAKTPHD